jgi:hypothetical protein
VHTSIKNLKPADSIKLLMNLGRLEQAQQSFQKQILASANQLQANLDTGISQISNGWDTLIKGALNAEVKDGVLPAEIKRLAPFVQDFGSVKEMLGTGASPSVSQLSGLLFSSGLISQNGGLGQAAEAATSIMQLKGDFSSAASGVLSTALNLSKSGVPIPGLREAVPLLSSASSIVQAQARCSL